MGYKFSKILNSLFIPEKFWFGLIEALVIIFLPQYLIYNGLFYLKNLFGFVPYEPIFFDTSLLMEVLASILGLFLVIFVFLFETARERDFEERVLPIYLTHTRAITVISFGLISLLSMTICSEVINPKSSFHVIQQSLINWNYLLFIFNIVLLLNFLRKAIRLLNPKNLRSLVNKSILEKNRETVFENLYDKISSSILVNESKESKFELEYLGIKPREHWYILYVNLPTETAMYKVADVNLSLLEKASERAISLQDSNVPSQIRIRVFPWERISHVKPSIALIPEEAARPQVTNVLKRAFKIKPKRESDLKGDLEQNFTLIKEAIKESDLIQLEFWLDLYIDVLKDYCKFMSETEIDISFNDVISDDEFFLQWETLELINDQIIDISNDGFSSKNRDIFDQLILFPHRVLVNSVNYEDHIVFQKFSRLYLRYYYILAKLDISDQEERMINAYQERTWEYPKNLYLYYLVPKLEYLHVKEDEITNIGNYCVYLSSLYAEFLKDCVDTGNTVRFGEIVKSVREIGSWMYPGRLRYEKHYSEGTDLKDYERPDRRKYLIKTE